MRMTSRTAVRLSVVVAAVLAPAVSPAAAHAADPVHDPTVACTFWRQSGVLVFGGVATAPTGHAAPVALTITCTFMNVTRRYTSVNTAPGYAVVTAGSGLMKPETVTVCESAVALYPDGHVGSVPERCYVPA